MLIRGWPVGGGTSVSGCGCTHYPVGNRAEKIFEPIRRDKQAQSTLEGKQQTYDPSQDRINFIGLFQYGGGMDWRLDK